MKFYKNKNIDRFDLNYTLNNSNQIKIISKNEKGGLSENLYLKRKLYKQNNFLFFKNHSDSRNFFAKIKLNLRSLISGYVCELKLVGLGYIVYKVKNKIVFDLGYSHYICYTIPQDIVLRIEDKNIILFCMSSEKLNTFVSILRSFKRINYYTGTGILYADQQIKLKEGKLR
uniref:Ribosomal protein L6 n=1 Tax=Heterostelium pallidum TaxID=13642 RepID=Q5ILK3_HETPA|nr:ribosomal protein L6 [Heterostelium pallidum]AAU00607.1 ribosomal protein L6 [Heterostelium pallidum]